MIDKAKCTYCENDPFPISDIKDAENMHLTKCFSNNNETVSRSPCMRPRSDPPKMKNSTPDKIVAEKKIRKKKITKRIGW